MVTIVSLWLPIVVATIAVFFLSFAMWMILPHHKKDMSGVPNEDALMGALRDQGVQPGQYAFPYCADRAMMNDPGFQKKFAEGPSGLLTVRPPGGFEMGKSMAQSIGFNLVISIVVAYVATFTLSTVSEGMAVFRLTATVAFIAYAGALGWGPIWWSKSWANTFREMFDGLVYGLGTGLVFMLLW